MSTRGAAEKRRLFKLLSSLRPSPDRSKGLPETLTGAVSIGDLELVRVFLAHGADLEERTIGFASPLAAACASGRTEVVVYLLERGAKVRLENQPFTPMYAAVANGHVEIVRMLMAKGATANDGALGFIHACQNGRFSVVKLLVESGLDLEQTGLRAGTTVRESAIEGAKRNSRPLIAAYVGGKAVDETRALAAEARAIEEDRSMAQGIAREAGREPVAHGEERERKLADALAIVRHAGLAATAWTNDQGEPVLCVAAANAVAPVVEALLDAGADANAVAPSSLVTPLIRATEGGSREAVAMLLARGADPNARAAGKFTALIAAVDFGDSEIVRMLLAAGADGRTKPADGRTAAKRVRGPYAEEIRALLREPGPRPPRR
jgi:ankyrin repeat protein